MGADRQLRADAERNRGLVLAAAARVLADEGVDAPVEAIAREAGVGVGTVYRRFPTKQELVAAILLERADSVVAGIHAAAGESDPWRSLELALEELASTLAAERGLFDVIVGADPGELPVAAIRARLIEAVEPVATRALDAGVLRPDVGATDLVALAAMVTRRPRGVRGLDPELWRRWLRVVLDGVRAGGANSELPLASPPRVPEA